MKLDSKSSSHDRFILLLILRLAMLSKYELVSHFDIAVFDCSGVWKMLCYLYKSKAER